MTTNHPAHGPVSLDRLHQISEILSKAAAQSDGGNLGYAMADAVKVIDGAIAEFGAEPVEFLPDNLDRALTILGVALPISKEEFNLDAERWMQRLINRVIRLESELTPPAPVVLEWTNDQCLEFLSIAFRHAEIKGDLELDDIRLGMKMVNESRDAMLQLYGNSEQLDEVGSWNNHRNTPTAQAGNSPVTPDTWIPVSERMPDNGGKSRELYLCWGSYFDGDKPDYIPAYFFIHPTNLWSEWEPVEDDCNPKSVIITHWMPLPAAPQQECKHEFVYGWHSYGSKSGYQCRFCGKLQEVKL